MSPKRPDNKRLKTVYLDKREFAVLEDVARANGQSANAVIRIALRNFLGMTTPTIAISDELRERHGLAASG